MIIAAIVLLMLASAAGGFRLSSAFHRIERTFEEWQQEERRR